MPHQPMIAAAARAEFPMLAGSVARAGDRHGGLGLAAAADRPPPAAPMPEREDAMGVSDRPGPADR